MIPEHLYMTDLGKIAYVALYLPLVLSLLWWLFRRFRSGWPLLVVFALALLTLPCWDVYMIGRDAERLCREQGGLHVYKVVEADGFLGGGSAERWIQYGFSYVESGGSGDRKFRTSIQEGKVVTEEVTEYVSRYRLAGENHSVISKHISRSSHQVISRITGEALGELVYYSIYPGYLDGILLKLTGSGPVVWHCGNDPPAGRRDGLGYGDVVMAVLKPKQIKGGVK